MAEELRFVGGNVLDADRVVVAAHLDDAIDHEERIAMRQQPQDVVNAGSAEALAGHASSPSGLPSLRTRRRSTATPFMKSRTGWAGEPIQRAPAGTFDM